MHGRKTAKSITKILNLNILKIIKDEKKTTKKTNK